MYFIFNQIATCLGVGGWALEKLQESVGKGYGDGEELENEGPMGRLQHQSGKLQSRVCWAWVSACQQASWPTSQHLGLSTGPHRVMLKEKDSGGEFIMCREVTTGEGQLRFRSFRHPCEDPQTLQKV